MFVIHAGLHKTGSTAIQNYLGHNEVAGVHYVRWQNTNHSALSVLLFDEEPQKYWVFRRSGRKRKDILEWRKKTDRRVRRELAENSDQTVVFSAERLAKATPKFVARMHEMFAPYADPFKVIIYVRPAEAYMNSMAQQHIRTGSMQIELVWPEYRQAIEKFDTIFGREAVDVRLYSPADQPGWDAVQDFCEATGIAPPIDQTPRANVRMGARHLALLLDRRVEIGHLPRGPKDQEADQRFLTSLLKEPSAPFALSPDLLQTMRNAHTEDLAWIEQRLGGVSMAETLPIPPGTVVFGSTEDVLNYAQMCKSNQI